MLVGEAKQQKDKLLMALEVVGQLTYELELNCSSYGDRKGLLTHRSRIVTTLMGQSSIGEMGTTLRSVWLDLNRLHKIEDSDTKRLVAAALAFRKASAQCHECRSLGTWLKPEGKKEHPNDQEYTNTTRDLPLLLGRSS